MLTQFAIRREHPVKPREVDTWPRHQRRQPLPMNSIGLAQGASIPIHQHNLEQHFNTDYQKLTAGFLFVMQNLS